MSITNIIFFNLITPTWDKSWVFLDDYTFNKKYLKIREV